MAEFLGCPASRDELLDRFSTMFELAKNDAKALHVLGEVTESAQTYVASIYRLETSRRSLPNTINDTNELQSALEVLDQRRTSAHNALIANLESCGRYFRATFVDEAPASELLIASPEAVQANKRNAIRDWAIAFVAAMTDIGR